MRQLSSGHDSAEKTSYCILLLILLLLLLFSRLPSFSLHFLLTYHIKEVAQIVYVEKNFPPVALAALEERAVMLHWKFTTQISALPISILGWDFLPAKVWIQNNSENSIGRTGSAHIIGVDG